MSVGRREQGRSKEEDTLQSSDSYTLATLDEFSKQIAPELASASELEEHSRTHHDGNYHVPSSSPHSPKVFKVPKIFWELEEDEAEEDAPCQGDRSGGRPVNGRSQSDEISRSYVEITSPSSTLLSSPPASQTSLPPNTSLDRKGPAPLQDVNQDVLFPVTAVGNNAQATRVTAYAGRSLRQRNPIQLHPYVVEQEKYRQTLKARGIAPMRIDIPKSICTGHLVKMLHRNLIPKRRTRRMSPKWGIASLWTSTGIRFLLLLP
jgi:hypothetical protein